MNALAWIIACLAAPAPQTFNLNYVSSTDFSDFGGHHHPHPPIPHAQRPKPQPKPKPKHTAPPPKATKRAAVPTKAPAAPIIVPPPAKREPVDTTPPIEDSAKSYFTVSDYDANGWVSYREANAALGVDRQSYAVFDTDRDGRVSPEEFEARYKAVKERTGGFKPPKPKTVEKLVPSRNAEQLRNAYDSDGDQALDLGELQKLLKDYNREQIPAEVVLEKLDRDGSKKLDGEELVLFSQLLSATYTPEQALLDPEKTPKSIDQLFGQAVARNGGLNTAPQPPQIKGPISHFRRLDLDGNGGVSLDDLRRLQSSVQLSVNLSGVFAALDTDGDGLISEAEFLNSMGKAQE